ncbi:hypothetical protein PPTG_16248 [Phytophthora nicotianae INRA-310]|uniref:PiggyBac transposable element-derived protein domain-containing protein n=1 Tax=Phytophthora nicotianae (strain INRA-310) TaxID=761204 RepID=W2PQW3_PHYN3|nr:hypothetical protein PPTG_16248 [Phytophthora nicotianae INRA-310]ETN02644.1 hypothetical protein PPTG_16248 [Phytophthora nicotianae INRA-310]
MKHVHRAVAAKTVAVSGRKAPVARKTKEQDEDYVPDEEEDLTPPRKKQKGARSTEAKKKVVKKTAVAKTKKTAAGTKKAAPKKPRNSTNAKAKEKEAKTAAAVKRCLASAAAEVEGAAAHKAARERLNNQASKSTDAANTTDDIASALTARMATTHHPVLHDQSPTSQEQDYTTFQRDTSTEDLLEIREPSDERAQPNAPVAELPEDESISTGTTGSGFLDSDCEDTEAEICFLDDDDELERARSETTSVNTADESSFLSDGEAESNHDDDADSNDQDCAESLADSHSTRVKCVTEARNGSFREGSQQYGRNASKWVDTNWSCGTGDYMPRHRFEHIMTNLHFTNNADAQAVTDRAWKVRLEVYCGSAQNTHEIGNVPENQLSADPNTGPSAVIRNLEVVLPAAQDNLYHLVVADRFYTSVQLAFQLLSRDVYTIGTIMGDRVGYPQEIVERSRDRPKGVPHGTVQVAVAKICPQMTGLVWWDRKPVQFLGTGLSRALETCQRRTRGSKGKRQAVPCPSTVRDYHRWMGGVDIHDQLRLLRYSLQLQTWCKKYYKTIFMGLIDVAIVNAYIVFREAQKRFDARPISHAEFLLKLHANMLDLDERSFTDQAPPTDIDSEAFAPMVGHEAQESPDYQIVNGVRKRRQRQCKVCSLLKRRIGERRATKYYCPTCSPSEKARTCLCQKVW